MTDCDLTLVTTMVDEFLVECGTQSLINGDKVRDMLLDVRSMCNSLHIPEVVPDNVRISE